MTAQAVNVAQRGDALALLRSLPNRLLRGVAS
jgi:hypothetical protein